MSSISSSVLIAHEHIGFLANQLAERYKVFKAWESVSLSARQEITVMIVAGEVPLSNEFIASFPNLRLIACFTTGYDGVDITWAASHGIEVTRAVGANSGDVADHTLGLLIAWQRDIIKGDHLVRTGGWNPKVKNITRSLESLSVGIVGMGAIGRAIADRCIPFRMKVQWWGPRAKPDVPFKRTDDLLSLAANSDVLVVASRAENTNRHMIGRPILEALGPKGLLINVARGSLIDEEALIDALRSHRVAGAALDVFEKEPTDPERWHDVPNVILTPHTAGATKSVLPKLIGQLQSNLDAYFAGERLVTPIAA
ncbi:2-hydroxyacid dehydrogenase [Ochrobactrum soli]|uniref:D-3-phosphoglycerate dehydrogenase n=1 Tax=Ochrobactrum soli TaxID=2448455 RepID=A0A2P9HEC0_9HYPH|nr:2-hydroxyacid dehydrogenase [[Ochrobactrum] soli]SPL62415.1 D-3-phosphoglycerate dehydrogenase [[Ochrobactrum] soli]